jgi:hypothetical protein
MKQAEGSDRLLRVPAGSGDSQSPVASGQLPAFNIQNSPFRIPALTLAEGCASLKQSQGKYPGEVSK